MKSDPTMNEISVIAELMYKVADDIEANDPDEQWRTVSKIKNSANDAYFYVAQVVGAGKAQCLEFDCINARKNLYTLKAMYIFAAKQKLIELEPENVVRIDKLVTNVDMAHRAGQERFNTKQKKI